MGVSLGAKGSQSRSHKRTSGERRGGKTPRLRNKSRPEEKYGKPRAHPRFKKPQCKEKDTFPSRYDETGESKVTGVYYYTDDGYAEISCYDFAKHIKIISGIDVSISTEELGDWLGNLRKN